MVHPTRAVIYVLYNEISQFSIGHVFFCGTVIKFVDVWDVFFLLFIVIGSKIRKQFLVNFLLITFLQNVFKLKAFLNRQFCLQWAPFLVYHNIALQIQNDFPLIMERLNYAKFVFFSLKLTIVTVLESEHECIVDMIYSAVDPLHLCFYGSHDQL